MLGFYTFMTYHYLYLLLYIWTKYRVSIIGRNERYFHEKSMILGVKVDCGLTCLIPSPLNRYYIRFFSRNLWIKSTSAMTNIIFIVQVLTHWWVFIVYSPPRASGTAELELE